MLSNNFRIVFICFPNEPKTIWRPVISVSTQLLVILLYTKITPFCINDTVTPLQLYGHILYQIASLYFYQNINFDTIQICVSSPETDWFLGFFAFGRSSPGTDSDLKSGNCSCRTGQNRHFFLKSLKSVKSLRNSNIQNILRYTYQLSILRFQRI